MSSILTIGTLECFDQDTNALIVQSNSLTTSGLDLSLTMDEVRGGMGNALQGFVPHTTGFGLTAEDSLFDLNYMALNCGGAITAGADVMTVTTITTTVNNQITAPTTPKAMSNSTDIVGWYKLANATDNAWTVATFVGSVATVSNLPSGSTICLKYFHADASAREFTISGAFFPAVVRAVLTFKLLKTGSSGGGSQSVIGELQFEVPNFQFAGNQSYSVSSSGTATTPLSGMALYTANTGCSTTVAGYYAKVKEIIYNKGTFDNVFALGVADGDIDIAVAGTSTIKVYAFYNDGTIPSPVSNSLLTFTSQTPAKATVGANTGICTGVALGNAIIDIVVTGKPSLSTTAVVTVA